MTQEEIIRRCAYAVAVATGIDPHECMGERKGDSDLQLARKLWIQLVCVECGVPRKKAASLCNRARSAVIYDLHEVEEWRDDEVFDQVAERFGAAVRALIEHAFAVKEASPGRAERYRARVAVVTP